MISRSSIQTRSAVQFAGIVLVSWTFLFCAHVGTQGAENAAQHIEAEGKACNTSDLNALLKQHFQLAQERTPEQRYYAMVTRIIYYEPDGQQKPYIDLKLLLTCKPAGASARAGYRYTCGKISCQPSGKPEIEIPALAGWSYLFKRTEQGGYDQNGLVLGIDHSKFQGLSDAQGNPMPPEMCYALYNAFIDFHAFCNNFAERSDSGNGIQHLNQVGQEIVHNSAFSEPSTHLAGNVAEGSYFKNGKVTLQFKGIGLVDTVPCAIVSFDSGKSSFKMAFKSAPDVKGNPVGGPFSWVGASHYWGDLFIELDTRWVRKCSMGELVVAQTRIGEQQTINSVMERQSQIRSIDRDEFTTATTAP